MVTQKETAMSEALDAIHSEAERLLKIGSYSSDAIDEGLQRIISIARYKHEIRTEDEQNPSR